MSDDIVARLRLWVLCYTAEVDIGKDLADAADEIERLREKLRSYTGDKHTTREPFTPEAL